MKREITPHKGGRTERLPLRLTEDEKFLIRENADFRKKNMTDFILEAVRFYIKKNPLNI